MILWVLYARHVPRWALWLLHPWFLLVGGESVLGPVGNGTDVQWAVSYTPPMGPLGKFMDVFMMNRVYQNEIEASLERLKAELET